MEQTLNKKIVLFDFDGVIVDSFEVSYQAAKEIGSPLTQKQQRKLFENNLFEVIKKLGMSISTKEKEKYYSKYIPKLFETPPIKGMEKILKELRKSHQLIVVSSTISSPINGYLNKYNLAQYFDAIMGGDVHKSKTVKIQMVLEQSKAKPEDCVFVTDTLGDMKEAAQCNVKSIGVTWGFHERERLEKGNFFALVDTVQELSRTIHSFFAKR